MEDGIVRDKLFSEAGSQEHIIFHIIGGKIEWSNCVTTYSPRGTYESHIGVACNVAICGKDALCGLWSSREKMSTHSSQITRTIDDSGSIEVIYCYVIGLNDPFSQEVLAIIHSHDLDRIDTYGSIPTSHRYRSLVETVPDLVGIIDSKGTILFTQRISESPMYKNLIGKRVKDVITPEDPSQFEAMIKEVFESGKYRTFNVLASGVHETPHEMEVIVWPITNGDSIERGYFVARDVTWEDEALSSLLEIEERFYRIFNDAPMGFVHANQQGIILDVNPALSQMLGVSRVDLVGSRLQGWFPECPENDGVHDLLDGALTSDRLNMEARMTRNDGNLVWVLIESMRESAPDGISNNILLMIDDRTQLMETQKALMFHHEFERTLRDFHRVLFDTPDDVVDSGLNRVIEQLASFLGTDEACICRYSNDTHEITVTNPTNPNPSLSSDEDAIRPLNGSTKSLCKQSLTAIITDLLDGNTNPSRTESSGTYSDDDLGSIVFVELFSMGSTRGYLVVRSNDPKRIWNAMERELIHFTGGLVSLKLNRVQLKQERESFFKHATDLLGIYSMVEGRFMSINPAFKRFLGYDSRNVGHIQILEKTYPQDVKRLIHCLKQVDVPNMTGPLQFRFVSEQGEVMWADLRFVPSTDGDEVYVIGSDVTNKKRTDLEHARSNMKYIIEEGLLYLEVNPQPELVLGVLSDLVRMGYTGVVLSRSPRLHIPGIDGGELVQYWFAEQKDDRAIPPTVEAIRGICSWTPPKSAILLDRLDYILNKQGFDSVLEVIHVASELAYIRQQIVLISIDPETFNPQQLKTIEKECVTIVPVEECIIPIELMDVLRVARIKALSQLEFGYRDLISNLNISRPTARKRIMILIDMDLLHEVGTGRRRKFTITAKGLKLFPD